MYGLSASYENRRFVSKDGSGLGGSDTGRYRSPLSGELSRLLSAALISPSFAQKLLSDPERALAEGYCGEKFELGAAESELVLSIRASTLQEFALELRNRAHLRRPEDPLKSNQSDGLPLAALVHHRRFAIGLRDAPRFQQPRSAE